MAVTTERGIVVPRSVRYIIFFALYPIEACASCNVAIEACASMAKVWAFNGPGSVWAEIVGLWAGLGVLGSSDGFLGFFSESESKPVSIWA